MWFKINRQMIPSKLCYFFQNAKASLQVYMILFLTDLGLNTQEASIISGIQFIGFVLGGPCLGFLADKFKCHYKIAQISLLISTISFVIGPVVGVLISNVETNRCQYSVSKVNFNLTKTKNETFFTNDLETNLEEKKKILLISLSIMFFTLASMFGDPVLGFVDAACVHKSSNNGKDKYYSHQRLFEPFGWQFGIIFASLFIKHFPRVEITCYFGVFVCCALYNILLMISFYALMRNIKKDGTFREGASSSFQGLWEKLKKLLTARKHILFFANVGIVGIFFGIHASLIYPYLEDLSGSLSYLNGYTATCSTTSIIVYIIAPAIYNQLQNHWLVFYIILVGFSVKMFIFSITKNLIILMSSGALFSFQAVFMITIVFYVKQEMPKELHSTIFNIVNVLLVSFGYVVANIIGGIIYNTYGPEELFFCAFILLTAWSFAILIYVLFDKCNQKCLLSKNEGKEYRQNQDVVIENQATVSNIG